MERKSLDEILDDDNGVEEVEETEAQPEPEASEPEVDEKGVGPEPEEEPPSVGLPKDVYEPLKAVRSENQSLRS